MLTLAKVQEATNTAAVTSYLENHVLPGSGWELIKARRRYVRLEPPDTYWAMYLVRLGRGEAVLPEPPPDAAEDAPPPDPVYPEERELRLVARASFKQEGWLDFAARLERRPGERQPDPLANLGLPVVFEDTQHVFWFFPFDPSLPTLAAAGDPARVLKHFRRIKNDLLTVPARIRSVDVKLARYVPEINGIFEYTIRTEPPSAGKRVYGKVLRGHAGQRTFEVMSQLHAVARRSGGRLRTTRPIGYYPDLRLYLEDAATGEAVSGDRTSDGFRAMALHAAEAIATIQDSGVLPDESHVIESDFAKLDEVMDQFALVHPRAHFHLRELIAHARSRLSKLPEEDWLPCHGDLKYDQFIADEDGNFTLIDFDYFTLAETSYDLARFCAYAFPSMPKGWEQSVAGEEARAAFIDRYLELRPHATLERFQVYEAVILGLRAMTAMWAQQRGWKDAIDALLTMAMERLNSRLP